MQAHKKMLLGAAIALAGAGAIVPSANARTVIYANIAPPAVRVETVPSPRAGYVWVNGNWYWHHRHYAWRKGHWMRARHGYRYVEPRWERDGRRWRYYDGRWEH
ncbi:MAG TPA: hypothetical protein VHE32_14060 [Rhodanobacteraceae bacterium]|jgi:hypothetical protein|nr:hypothetical protein [Rhodanobacteraceae bacterium]